MCRNAAMLRQPAEMLSHSSRQVGARLPLFPEQRAAVLLALSAAVLLQTYPRPVSAHEDPARCQTVSATLRLNLYYNYGPDRPGPGGSVSPCETVKYKGSLLYPPSGCSFEGGRLTLTSPDGQTEDVTPPGGIPKLDS